MGKNKKLVVLLTIIILAFSASIAFADDASPRLTLSGINVAANGTGESQTLQAKYSLHLDGVDAVTAGFTLRYDKRYIKPSDFTTNEEIDGPVGGDEQVACDNMYSSNADTTELMYLYDKNEPNYGYLTFSTVMIDSSANFPGRQNGGFDLGSLSFKVQDGVSLGSLSYDDLKNILCLYNAEDTTEPFAIGYDDGSELGDVYDDPDTNWKMDIKYNPEPVNVEANLLTDSVTAEEIYQAGDVTDLIEYLKVKCPTVTVTYLDGSTGVVPFVWDNDKSVLADGEIWDPKGGTYNLSQPYPNSSLNVAVEVTVSPVTVQKFVAEPRNKDYIGYAPENKPTALEDLDFPNQARPVYDKALIHATSEVLPISGNQWQQTKPDSSTDDFFANPDAEGEYTFTNTVVTDDLPVWATLPDAVDRIVDVIRFVGELTADPDGITSVTDDGGNLVITVPNLGSETVPDGTKFFVRLPDGTDIDEAGVTVSIADGIATITVSHTALPQTGVQQATNKGGSFSIAAQAVDKGRSNFTSFTADPRKNIYLEAAYSFDYSGVNKGKFPIGVGYTLPTGITLPGTDHVTTTYDGVTGLDGGKLQTIEVESWTLKSGDANLLNEVLVYEGVLASDYDYTGYGHVLNEKNSTVTLTLQTDDVRYSVDVRSSDNNLGTAAVVGPDLSFSPGDEVTVKYTEAAGTFKNWITVPADITLTPVAGTPGQYTFTMPASNVTLTAVFDNGGSTEDGLQNIVVHDGTTEATTYPMYSDIDLANVVTTFDPDTNTYFVRVPQATNSVSLWLTAGSEPAVKYDDNDDTVNSTGEGTVSVVQDATDQTLWKTDLINLNEVNQSLGEPDHKGFNNTVQITMGDGAEAKVYNVYIQRLTTPRIELAYGNSPVGMIMNSSVVAEEDKEAAIQAFKDSGFDPKYPKYKNNNFIELDAKYIPTDQFKTDSSVEKLGTHYMDYTQTRYSTRAWEGVKDENGEVVNYDYDDKAIFVYAGRQFVVPGFTAYDAEGKVVNEKVTVSNIKDVVTFTNAVTPNYTDTEGVKRDLVPTDGVYDLYDIGIRPDIYWIDYVYKYGDAEEDTITVKRPVIILGTKGDVLITPRPTVTAQDGKQIVNNATKWTSLSDKNHMSMYLFRIADVQYTQSPAVTAQDGKWLVNNNLKKTEFIQWYNILPSTVTE